MKFELAKYHKKFNKQLYKKVMKQPIALVKNLATNESRKLYRLHKEVMTCIHLNKGFMRFEVSKHGILYGKIKLEHNVIEYILQHFNRRYPIFYIALEYNNKTYVVDPQGNKKIFNENINHTIKYLEEKLPSHPMCEELQFEDNLWYCYYDSQYIKEKRNLSLMKKIMPLKYRQEDSIETFISKRSKHITDYV